MEHLVSRIAPESLAQGFTLRPIKQLKIKIFIFASKLTQVSAGVRIRSSQFKVKKWGPQLSD